MFSSPKELKRRGCHLDKRHKFIVVSHYKCGLSSTLKVLKPKIIPAYSPKYFQVYNKFTDKEWEDCLKFTIVRNPYDRVLSAFFFLQRPSQGQRIKKGTDFKVWCKTNFKNRGIKINPHFRKMYPKISIDGVPFIDTIIKLETINKRWPKIAKRINIKKDFPKTNSTVKNKPRNRYDFYDQECVDIVTDIYQEDLEKFNYEF